MPINDKNYQEKIFLYVDALELGPGSLSETEMREMEAFLEKNDDCRRKAEEIRAHLRFLNNLPQPQPSDILSSRCLAVTGRIRDQRMFSWRTVFSGAVVTLLVFVTGLWIGSGYKDRIAEKSTIEILMETQNKLIERLEESYAQQPSPVYAYLEYHLAQLKREAQIIEAYSIENSSDPTAEYAFNQALYQNIILLKSLCERVEENRDVSDREQQIIRSDRGLKLT